MSDEFGILNMPEILHLRENTSQYLELNDISHDIFCLNKCSSHFPM